MHRTASTTKNYLTQNVNRAKERKANTNKKYRKIVKSFHIPISQKSKLEKETLLHTVSIYWLSAPNLAFNIYTGIMDTISLSISRFEPWVRKIPWRRAWQPTPVFLPGEFHEQRSLVGYSPWGRKESDMTERLHFHFSLSCIGEGNGNPLQYSCLENSMNREAWWATVHGVTKSQTWLSE